MKEELRSVLIVPAHLLPCCLSSEGISFISGQCLLGDHSDKYPECWQFEEWLRALGNLSDSGKQG